MNDTETEARRLLAAATEDMPPGIDLLGEFAAARRRGRARRARRGALLSAGIAAAASAVTAVALTAGSAAPARAAVTSALASTLAQSYHVTAQQSSYYIQDGQVTGRSHLAPCATVADPARHLWATSCSNVPHYIEVGGYVYLYFAHPADHPGRHWERFPAASLVHPAFFTNATPQQMLAEIKKAAKVTVAGPASGPGWAGTLYAFSGDPGARDKVSGTVSVDQQGRVRALALTTRVTSDVNVWVLTQALTFSDFGVPVTVAPPPADQTFDFLDRPSATK